MTAQANPDQSKDTPSHLPDHACAALVAIQRVHDAILIELARCEIHGWFPECRVGLRVLQDALGLNREVIRGVIADLRARNFVVYERGLWTEDGQPAGAGYGITYAGFEHIRQTEAYAKAGFGGCADGTEQWVMP